MSKPLSVEPASEVHVYHDCTFNYQDVIEQTAPTAVLDVQTIAGDSPEPASATAIQFRGPFRRFRQRLVDGLVAKGVPQADAIEAVGQLGDGSLLKWLIEHGDDIIALVMRLLSLFK